MYSKLSLRNAKRSFLDYAIYFLTLTIAVCLFYTFNSIAEQQIMLDVSVGQKDLMNHLSDMLSVVSVFVSLILCCLILFANQFMIKRRKKEFGLYMTLGMSKGRISRILITETSFIGFLSLGTGLLTGGIVSQAMSVLTASLFDVAIKGYHFIFSADAMVKTIVYFSIIFILVMIFNTIVVSRYSLIDLLTSLKKNERIKVRNARMTGILFILSMLMITGAYFLINRVGLGKNLGLFSAAVGIAVVGTFLFFFSGTSFVLMTLQKNKKVYFNEMNMFVLRQVHSKVNTNFLSITIISFMLFFTMTILSAGFGYKHAVESDLKKVAPYDASITIHPLDDKPKDYTKELKDLKIDIEKYGEVVSFIQYRLDIEGVKLLAPYAKEKIKEDIEEGFPISLTAIKYSDYVKLMQLQGSPFYSMNENETFIITNMKEAESTIANFVKNHESIQMGSKVLGLMDSYHSVAIETENVGRTVACFVVPDEVADQLSVNKNIYNVQYYGSTEGYEQELRSKFQELLSRDWMDTPYYMQGVTKSMVYEEVAGQTSMIIYIGIYLGIVFLISSAAVLALQQLSEASDSSDRYNILKRIGATNKQINKAVLSQLFIYFMTPLSLALSHSIFTIYFINKSIVYGGISSIILPACITSVLLLLIYGGYFMATYSGYKRIVK
ncbi:FtsX-like permease family protein [Paenibacillus sp. EC2-1]|uniref:FtsX-like permease family protein n=1 Tax=Paenibacillus sp. EC2-1 TaxID=3388665 RepID=UPI003BEF1708